MKIRFKLLYPNARMPEFGHDETDAGLDLFLTDGAFLEPGGRATLSTGVIWDPPKIPFCKISMMIRPRSGVTKTGLHVAVGTIDEGYRGEIKVMVENRTREAYQIAPGERIAQGVIEILPKVKPIRVSLLSKSVRGERGFGSTGK